MGKQWILGLLLSGLLAAALASGCAPSALSTDAAATPSAATAVVTSAAVEVPPATAAPLTTVATESVTPRPVSPTTAPATAQQIRPTLQPDEWKSLPVIPTLSARALEIYQRGLEMGNNPRAFSKIGDCESRTTWFLADFDLGTSYYSLGAYKDLQNVIDYFSGSFDRLSQVAKPGFTAASVMTPLWADPKICEKDESPLACEYREQRPAFALITLGTNDVARPETFETNLRRVIEFTIEQGVVPVLATKADNLEGNHAINDTIARLAVEYDIPLWNFWAAVQSLPDHGLQEDGAHLTWSPNTFDDSQAMLRAWPVRNLTALQVLDALMKGVNSSRGD